MHAIIIIIIIIIDVYSRSTVLLFIRIVTCLQFGKVGRIASEEVVLELVSKKCMPVLLYGLEVCPLTVTDKKSLDFPVTRFLMKLFNTVNMDVINLCRNNFGFALPSERLVARVDKFLVKYACSENIFCSVYN